MAHTLVLSSGSVAIYVDDISNEASPIIAKHQILDAQYTTMQYMGGESYIKSLRFTATSASLVGSIKSDSISGAQVFYTDDTGDSGSFVITKFTYARIQALNYAYPWFKCTLSLTNLFGSGSLYYQRT